MDLVEDQRKSFLIRDTPHLFEYHGDPAKTAGAYLDDRAFTLLLCRRFAEPLYADRLPGWWRDELIHADDPLPALKAFWDRQP